MITLSLGKLIKKFRELRRITQKTLGDRTHLDDVKIRQYEFDIRTPKEDVLENISAALHVNKEYLKEPDYPYTEHELMRFLFKLGDNIEPKFARKYSIQEKRICRSSSLVV